MLSERGADRAGILKNPADDAAPVWLTYFGVEDPVAAAARVEALGGKVILPPSPQLRDGTMAVVADPTGALFALQKVSPGPLAKPGVRGMPARVVTEPAGVMLRITSSEESVA